MAGLFITGTDTGIGKTLIAALLVRALDANYWKPVQSGLEPLAALGGEPGGDSELVRHLAGLPAERCFQEAWRLPLPASPHLSAATAGVEIKLEGLQVPPHRHSSDRPLLVEGAGGVLVPLNRRALMTDLMVQLGFPVVVVTRSTLGTINHTLLTLEALRARGLDVAGVIVNGPRDEHNEAAIRDYGQVTLLGRLTPLPAVTPETVAAAAKTLLGIEELALLAGLLAAQD